METDFPLLAAIGGFFLRFARRVHQTLFKLSDTEQRSLMTWGMLGGIVALSGILVWLVSLMHERLTHYPLGNEALAIINGVFVVAYSVIGLIAIFAVGIVAIARNGNITAKLTKDGAEVSIQAAGSAAKAVAADSSLTSNLAAATQPAPH